VYSALDRELGRKVAIKILADRSARDEQVRAWLRREAMAVARLSHVQEVVRVYDVGTWHGRPYMAMEFLGGGSLASRLQRGPITR
jgi:serine/threonine protein kinase